MGQHQILAPRLHLMALHHPQPLKQRLAARRLSLTPKLPLRAHRASLDPHLTAHFLFPAPKPRLMVLRLFQALSLYLMPLLMALAPARRLRLMELYPSQAP